MFDPVPWRNDTPAARAGRIHLNNAGAALMPTPVLEAMTAHFARESQMGGYEAAEAASAEIETVYDDVAALVRGRREEIAVVENATVAFAQALSSFDFERGDVILTTNNDYISNQLMYLSLARRLGVEVVRACDLPGGGVDAQSVRTLLREKRPKVVAATWIPTNSGLVQDVAAVGRECAEAGVPYIVDACQAVGQIDVDVSALHCDFLSTTARKFLRGPRGIGFLWVSERVLAQERAPLWIDMRGAEWTGANSYRLAASAQRFENWEFAYALVLGLGAAAKYALGVGLAEAGKYAAELAAHARGELAKLPGARVLDEGGTLGAIVTVALPGHNADDVVARLHEQAININATYRDYAVIDMDRKGVRDALRISPHYYNTRREVDLVVGALEEFAGG